MAYARRESPVDIVWEAIPGFFLVLRLFLTEFQSYFISRLSCGVLRLHLEVDRVLSESVALGMW